MTARKRDIALPTRTPAYVSREIGAAELCISPDTWDQWVANGTLPKPVALGKTGGTPRWKWADVERHIDGTDATVQAEPPFFDPEGLHNGKAKGGRRVAS